MNINLNTFIANTLCVTENEVFRNAKVLCYPNDNYKVVAFKRAVFKRDGFEREENKRGSPPLMKADSEEHIQRADNVRRAKNKIYDIAVLNCFDYFVTFTLNADNIDRYAVDEISRRFKKWLQNMVQRRGIRYLIVPEHHKDGAIHFHGLISGGLRLQFSETYKVAGHKKPMKLSSIKRLKIDVGECKKVYNVLDFPFGYSTALPLDDNVEKIATYVTKYIEKDLSLIFGNFYFAGGRDLQREVPYKLYNLDFEKIDCKEYDIPNANNSVKYKNLTTSRELSSFIEQYEIK